MQSALLHALTKFAYTTLSLPDAALDTTWSWGSYTDEGVRFAHFRVFEELQTLAVALQAARQEQGPPLSRAQRILGQYHLAYRDLQAVLLGVDDDLGAKRPPQEPADSGPEAAGEPSGEEWSVQRALAHIVQADLGFFAVVRHAVEQIRAGVAEPAGPGEADYDRILQVDEAAYDALTERPLHDLQSYLEGWHARFLEELSDIQDRELETRSRFWEQERYPLRFRLGRFSSHMRQHTIQIEKTIAALGQSPGEAKRLHRLSFAALAEAEAATLGVPHFGRADFQQTAATITQIQAEVSSALQRPG